VFPSDDNLPAKMPLKDFAAYGRGLIADIAYLIHNGQHVAAAKRWLGPLKTLCSYWLINPVAGCRYLSRPPLNIAAAVAVSDGVVVAGPADGLYSADAVSLDADKGMPTAPAAKAIKAALAGCAAKAKAALTAEPPFVVARSMREIVAENFLPGGVHHPVPVVLPTAFKLSVGTARDELCAAPCMLPSAMCVPRLVCYPQQEA
jgi:hypothetical protein